ESDSIIPDPSHQTVTSTPPVIAPIIDFSSPKPSSQVTTLTLLEITPFIALQLRVAKLEQDMSEVKKTDHFKYSVLPGPESIKNQESKKSPKEIIRVKKEQGKKKQESTYTIRSTVKVALKEFDLKNALFKHMHKNKTANRNPANFHLYHALMEALIADEDDMDKEVKDRVKDHKRKHDSASGSAQPPPKDSDESASKQHPTLTSTGCQITDTTDDVIDSSMHRSEPESGHSEHSSDDVSKQDEGHVSDLEDTDNAHIPKVTAATWFKPIPEDERPATPEPEWTIPPNDFPKPENNWANAYATTYQVPAENKLQRKTYDIGSFIKWFCRRTGKKLSKLIGSYNKGMETGNGQDDKRGAKISSQRSRKDYRSGDLSKSCGGGEEDIQCAGSDTRPPMLDKADFASWQQRIRLYCRGKDNGVNILKSIDEGPFQMGTTRVIVAEGTEGPINLGPERPRVYSDLSQDEKDRYNADIRATNIILQGLPKDIYSLINHYTDAKDIWDNVKMLLEGSELTKEDRESQLYDDFEHFRQNKGETIHDYYVRFAKLINDMRNIKMTMSKIQLNSKFVNNMLPEWGRFVTAVKLNKGLKDSNFDQLYAYLKQHEAHANENKMMLERLTQQTVDPLALMSNVSPQHYHSQSSTIPPTTYHQPHSADTSQYDLGLSLTDNLIENLTNTLALLTQSYKTFLPQTNNQLRTSSNPRTQASYSECSRVGNANLCQARQVKCYNCNVDNAIDEDMDEQPVQDLALNVDNVFQADNCDAYDSDVDEAPTTQTMFMVNLSSADLVCDKADLSYDSDVLSEEQVEMYERRAKFELTKREQKIDEQLRIVISGHNIKEEHLKKELHSVKLQLVSTLQHNKLMVDEVTFLKKDFNQKENKYLKEFLDLKALKDKVKDKLFKQGQSIQTFHMMCKPRSYYDEMNKVAIGYKNPLCLHRARQVWPALYSGHVIVTPNHAPAVVRDGEETLELTKISRKKMHEKTKANECVDNKVNIELPNYLKENFLATFTPQKQLTPKQIFWSHDIVKMKAEAVKEQNTRPIKVLTVYPPNTPTTLVPKVLPTKSQLKYQNLKDSFQNKPSSSVNDTPDFNSVFVIGQMKASLQGKDNISQLTEKVNGLQEQNEIFRAENAKIKQHYKELYDSIKITRAKHIEHIIALKNENESLKVQLENTASCVTTNQVKLNVLAPGKSLASACHYTKHSQELLEYVFGTCPKVFNQQNKKHTNTPRKKQVTFEDQIATSSSTTYKHVEPMHTQKSNVHVPPSTGVNSCTEASESQPRSILKKHRIPLAKSDSLKKVEDHPRTIRSSLKTTNRVDSSISSKRCSKHMMGDRSRLMNFVKKFIGTVRFGNDHFGAIMGYGDYVISDSVISMVYYVEGLGHNLFSVCQICDSNLEVSFRKHSCYVHDTDGVELLKGPVVLIYTLSLLKT
ncbi:hypothetical protein Tco_0949613, partial [Tanacetum coccineum]